MATGSRSNNMFFDPVCPHAFQCSKCPCNGFSPWFSPFFESATISSWPGHPLLYPHTRLHFRDAILTRIERLRPAPPSYILLLTLSPIHIFTSSPLTPLFSLFSAVLFILTAIHMWYLPLYFLSIMLSSVYFVQGEMQCIFGEREQPNLL